MTCRRAETREYHIAINTDANVFRVELNMLQEGMMYPTIESATPRWVMVRFTVRHGGDVAWFVTIALSNRTGRSWAIDYVHEKYYLTIGLEEPE